MQKNKVYKFFSYNIFWYLSAFLLTLFVLFISMTIDGIFPFGDKSVLKWDLEIQYIDIYAWFRNALHNGDGLFYSFSKSLGGNMFGVFSLYLGSPFNLLIYFFEVEDIPVFLVLLTVLKLCLAAVTVSIFITRRFALKSRVPILICSVAYALFEYNVAFCSNLHFLDAVYMLPLAALGVWQLINYRKKALLYITTAYVIICNWYIGYMVCLFTVFDFIFEYYLNSRGKSFKEFFSAGIRYISTMVLGVLTSAVFFLPSVLASMNGKGVLSFDKLIPDFHVDPLYPLRALFITAPTNVEHGMPAIYISYLIVILCIMFLINKRIDKRLRRAVGGFLLFVFISFSFVPLEIIWTDFKETYSFHHRYAFVFGLLMVIAACFYLRELEKNRKVFSRRQLLLAGIMLGGWFIVQDLVSNLGTIKQVLFTLFLILGYLVLLTGCIYFSKRTRMATGILLLGLFAFEQTYNVANAFEGYNITVNEYKDYTQEMKNEIRRLKTDEEKTFYRIEKTFSEMSNRRDDREPAASEAFVYEYNGVTHYSSIYDGSVNDFLVKLGYCKQDAMASNYVDTNFLADSLLGIRYIISEEDQQPVLNKIADYPERDGTAVYKNEYALDFGTVCVGDTREFKWGADPFENAQIILNTVLNEDNTYYTYLNTDLTDAEDVTWDIEVSQTGPVYAYFNSGHSDVDVYVNGEFKQTYFGRFYKNVMYLGNYEEGDIIHLSLKDTHDQDYDYHLVAVCLNEEFTKEKLAQAQKDSFDPDIVKGGYIKGTYMSESTVNMVLQVPYDSGWEITVNGEKTSYKEAFNGLIEIQLPDGESDIEMKYTPPGLIIGSACTIAGIAAFSVWSVVCLRKRKVKV